MTMLTPLTLLLVSAVSANIIDNSLESERTLEQDDSNSLQKAITYKSAGDYTLVSIPWSGATSLQFNDTTAATLSTIGNAALLVGGLYLLSGFPSAIARSDPFGISKRFGKPAPPPKFYKPLNSAPEQTKKRRVGVSRRPSARPIDKKRGPLSGVQSRYQPIEERQLPKLNKLNKLPEFTRSAAKKPVAEERQLPQLPRPSFPSLRPLQFRMPQLPNIRLPTLPSFRRPAAARPAPPQNRPQPSPAPAAARPAPTAAPAVPVFRPAAAATAAPAARPAPVRQSAASRPASPAAIIPPVQQPIQTQTVQTAPRPASQADFGSAFDTDPFREFQTADFGGEESFRDLIAAQFGDSFDLKRLPSK